MKFELNKLFNLFKNDKIVTTFLLKFWDLSGAKVWKSCRSRKSWKNEYLVAIVAVDTAENGPPKVWPNWITYSVVSLAVPARRVGVYSINLRGSLLLEGAHPNFRQLVLGCIDSYDSNQILIFSGFSRSTRFAKWISGILQIFAEFREIFMKFPDFWRLLLKSQQIVDFPLQFFHEIWSELREITDNSRNSMTIAGFF